VRHRFHALCPYFAMFPETFAEKWILELSRRGEVVLDPFSGRGTTAFQSLLLERAAVACDVNDVAYCVTKAKVHAPPRTSVLRRLTELEQKYKQGEWLNAASALPEFFRVAYSDGTRCQVLYMRESLKWRSSNVDCLIAALVLGMLHGETNKSPSYLSNQMPRTISTKPVYSVKFWKANRLTPPDRDAFELLRAQAQYRYVSTPPRGHAMVIHGDMRQLAWLTDKLPGPVRLAVTSPPYLDVTNFEEDQWLRLWFLGGPPYPTRSRISRDDRHESAGNYWAFIADMWRMLGAVMAKKGNVVIRLGGRTDSPETMLTKLRGSSMFSKRKISLVTHSCSQLQNRQTDSFRPGTKGCRLEIDCHFRFDR
jgi:hypothetical protein